MSFDKSPWRERFIRALEYGRRFEPKIWEGDKLRYPVLDMLGKLDDAPVPRLPEMYLTLQPYLKTPEQFVAVERDPDIVYNFRKARQAGHVPFTVHHGDAYRIAHRACTGDNPIGVLCFDGFGMVGNIDWWEATGTLLQSTINKTCDKLGFCVMVLNKVLDPRSSEPQSALLRRHSEEFLKLFGRQRELSMTTLLGENLKALKLVDDRQYGATKVGAMAGAYDISLSGGRTVRMATLRLLFRGSRQAVRLDP